MAEPTWGALDKSQVDDETIEEAIARLIDVHLADADAHADAGESLDVHKEQATVDHPRGSILADKESFTEVIAKCTFESFDNWTTVGDVTLNEWPGAELYVIWGAPDLSRLYSEPFWLSQWLDYAKNMLFQTALWITEEEKTKAYVFFGKYTDDTHIEGFGFQIIGTVVKGFWGTIGAVATFTADLNIDPLNPHVYRVEYDATNENVKFYIDGVLKATIENIGDPVDVPEALMEFRAMTIDDESEFYVKIKHIVLSRQI